MEVTHERVAGAGVELHVARTGAGPPVLLLHGFPEDWRTWRGQMERLARAGYTALAPDLRGYGDSDRPRDRAAYRLPALVEDVAALARWTGAPRVRLVGHDWGGVVAWGFAAAHPELLERLVILNAPHARILADKVRRPPQMLRSAYVAFFRLPWLPERALSARDFALLRRMFRATASPAAYAPADVDGYVAALSRPGALTAALDYYRANAAPRALSLAARRVEAETLVIWGERDPALGVELLDGLERVAPRARVLRVPTAGHWVHREAPRAVADAMLAFLE